MIRFAPCALCAKVRAHLPAMIRRRLAEVEARIAARRETERARDEAILRERAAFRPPSDTKPLKGETT